jgi:hypothetical protein
MLVDAGRRMLLRFAAAVVLLASGAATAAPLAVPLVLEEAAGVARRAWPATASVPLPRGRVRAVDGVWVATPAGDPAPAQARALGRWPDGSIRWLLVDFLADVPRRGTATYTLRDGKRPHAKAPPAVRVEHAKDGGRVLDTGSLRVTVPATGAAFLADVSAGSARLAGPVALPALAVRGVKGGAPSRDAVEVENEGPVVTEVVVRGRYPQGLTYELRIAAFAGQPYLRLRHTITNMADPHYAPIESLRLTVPARLDAGALGVDGGTRALRSLDGAHELVHEDATPVLVDGNRAGRHSDGWVRGSGPGVAVTLFAPDFWQQYPKALRVAPDGVTIDLFAGRAAPVQFGTGAAKTHEVWIAVEPADGAVPPGDLAAALAAPLVTTPPAAWIVASRAVPQAIDPDSPGARDFLSRFADAYEGYRTHARTERWDDGPPVPCEQRTTEHPRVGLYGDLNWGDWQFPGYRDRVRGCDGWGNLEYDLPQVLALAWLATGSRAFYDGLVPAARHYRDVDVIHHSLEHPGWVGMNHPHKALHFAFEAREGIDLGHTWTEGLLTFYHLTGEVRALEAARGIGQVLVGRVTRADNPRQFGWPMLALVALYDATGERRWLDAAREYADAAVARYRATPAAGDWKVGILADGVAAVHAASPEERYRRWLTGYADAYVAARGRWPDPRFALPLGYLAALTGEPRYQDAALGTAREMKIGDWGKPLAAIGRTGFRLLGPLAVKSK